MHAVSAIPSHHPRFDRFLVGIIAGLILLLVGAGISLVVLRQPAAQLPADTPGGTVQRFYAALTAEDYEKAYTFLSDSMKSKPTQEEYVRYLMVQGSYLSEDENVSLDEEKIYGDTAVVRIRTTHYYNSGPFGGSGQYSDIETFQLHRDAGGWRFTELPYQYTPYHTHDLPGIARLPGTPG